MGRTVTRRAAQADAGAVQVAWARRCDAAARGRGPTGGEVVEGRKIFHHATQYIITGCRNGDVIVLHNNCILSSKKKTTFVAKGIWYGKEDWQNVLLSQPLLAAIAARRRH